MTAKNNDNPRSIEERLQPWIEEAETLIAVTLIIMAWVGAWVNLIGFESFDQDILGQYSVGTFTAIVLFTIGLGLWLWIFFSLKMLRRFKAFIALFQTNLLLFISYFVFAFIVGWTTIYVKYWTFLPLLQGAILFILAVVAALIIFPNLSEKQPIPTWRKAVMWSIGAFVGIEIILHALAVVGVSPIQNTNELYEPYSVIYQNQEGHTYGRTNQFGFYYPPVEIAEDNTNVILLGDTYLHGLEVAQSEHMGIQLQALVDGEAEIIPTTSNGYGASTYLNDSVYDYLWDYMAPDEFIVYIHLANDFQSTTEPFSDLPHSIITEGGGVEIHPDDNAYHHVLEHILFDGNQPPALLESAFSYSFLISRVRDFLSNYLDREAREVRRAEEPFRRQIIPVYDLPMPIEYRTDDMPFGRATFLFETDSENDLTTTAHTIMAANLLAFDEFLAEKGIEMKIVTIPFFPESFYDTFSGDEWEREFDSYDLFQPEDTLVDFAQQHDIPIIATGAAMQASGLTVEDIQAMFYRDGTGHFTASGHQYFAELTYACFFSDDCPIEVAGE